MIVTLASNDKDADLVTCERDDTTLIIMRTWRRPKSPTATVAKTLVSYERTDRKMKWADSQS